MITRLNVSMCVNDGNSFPRVEAASHVRAIAKLKFVTRFKDDALCPLSHFVFHFYSQRSEQVANEQKDHHKNYSLMVWHLFTSEKLIGKEREGAIIKFQNIKIIYKKVIVFHFHDHGRGTRIGLGGKKGSAKKSIFNEGGLLN